MKFKFWSDTNMVNACTTLDEQGLPFKADMVRNTVEVTEYTSAARAILEAEGGEEVRK